MLRRAVVLALFAACAGCIPFVPCYYAYPSISYVPSVDTACGTDVRAFRVDVAEKQNGIEFPALDSFVFTEVPVWPKGGVAGQTQLAIDYGMEWNCLVLDYVKHTSHKVLVRLYRPGFETVEIRSCVDRDLFGWTAAPDLPAQEQAIDDLFAASEETFGAWLLIHDKGNRQFAGLEFGSTGAAHKKALLFAASEYERLAAGVLDEGEEGEATRHRLRDKAARFHKLALE